MLILLTFVGKEDVLEHWGWHKIELAADTFSLFVLGEDLVWKETAEVEAIAFFKGESRTLGKVSILKKINANLLDWKSSAALSKVANEVWFERCLKRHSRK